MVRRFVVATLVLSAAAFSAGSMVQAATPSIDGDVNGDGALDISDAVYIVQYLYLGGSPPVKPECEGAPTGDLGRIRFGSDIFCGATPVGGTLVMCTSSAADVSDPGFFIPTDCIEIPAAAACPVRVTANAAECGALLFCGELPVAKNDVWSFVLYFDVALQAPAVGYYHQVLDDQGACPNFPDPSVPFDGFLSMDCGTAAGGGIGASDWSSNR